MLPSVVNADLLQSRDHFIVSLKDVIFITEIQFLALYDDWLKVEKEGDADRQKDEDRNDEAWIEKTNACY